MDDIVSVMNARNPHYDFLPVENSLVKVQPSGDRIRVGFKDAAGREFSWFEPTHPFKPQPFPLPPQGEWGFEVQAATPDEQKIILSRANTQHVLTLTVTDPTAHPKPVRVTWE